MKAPIALLLVLAGTAGSTSPQDVDVERVGWLQGCWELVTPQTTIEEHWMAPRGASMVGVSRTVRAGRLVAFETVVIREEGERLVFEAYPSGQDPAAFHSTVLDDDAVVFENLDHDFPQRIAYRLSSADSLTAWIEGTNGGEPRRIEFGYRRVACPGD